MTDSPSSHRSAIDDLNVSRLNLIVALDKVDSQQWSVEGHLEDRVFRITCKAGVDNLVPHGLDNDVSAALVNLYIAQGCPEDGAILTSATELLTMCGWSINGYYYAALNASLDRLSSAKYTISGGWRDHPNRRWTHASFHFIERLEFSTPDKEVRLFDTRTILKVTLAQDIRASVNSGYVKPLDTDFMVKLNRPRTRALYRILDAARYDINNPDVPLAFIERNVLEWGDQCKINTNGRAWQVVKTLAAPHDELIKRGYLREVTYSGRGKDQRIRYDFVQDYVPVDPVVSRRLSENGITTGVARKLMKDHDRAFLMECVDRFDWLVRTQALVVKKSRAAALMHLIAHPDDYPYPAAPKPATIAPIKPARAATSMPALIEVDPYAQYEGVSAETAAARLLTSLNVHYRKLLNAGDLDMVRQGVLDGTLQAADVAREAVEAVVQMKREAFVAALRSRLG
ncbi:replication initiator protein A [Deinococcus hohokamensis]|uniref:Replication initiator protein A n=1 Tax=Deinococcus hohokamensis TaxID=309883 RepID=A0ABV9I6R1_9DEIO